MTTTETRPHHAPLRALRVAAAVGVCVAALIVILAVSENWVLGVVVAALSPTIPLVFVLVVDRVLAR